MKVRFLDLAVHDAQERRQLLAAVDGVLRHGRLVLGPEVEELERRFAAACHRKLAVGVNSGTDALVLALRALGLGPGDEVIVPAMSWIATANAVRLVGATPVFADVGQDLNLDPAGVEPLVTPRTRALLPVHYHGKVCDMAALQALARGHGLFLVEDAAQAFGATRGGRPAGSFGVAACFSMNPMKVLAALGEAGMVVTDDDALAQRLVSLRYNGTVNREDCHWVSHNGRLDTIQAAMLLCRLDRLEARIERRRAVARRYHQGLAGCPGLHGLPLESPGCRDVYYTYTIRTDRRDELMAFLEARGIEVRIRHPLLMPQHTAYRAGARGHWPRAAQYVTQCLSLPMHEKLTDPQVDYVIDAIRRFHGGRA